MAAKDDARALVAKFAARDASSIWINIRRGDVARDLRTRIDSPNLVDSSLVNLCGPAAFFRNLDLDDPVSYVTAAIDLYDKTTCSIGTLNVRTNTWLWTSSAPKGMTSVDWMMLASLRNSQNTAVRYESASDGFAGITMPSGLSGWFQAAGYTSTINETNVLFTKSEAHIRRADMLYDHGYKVCLFICAKMLKAATHANRSFTPDHWVVLDSPITLQSGNISCRVFSWGDSMPVPESGKLSVDNFLKNYYGFVAAKFR